MFNMNQEKYACIFKNLQEQYYSIDIMKNILYIKNLFQADR